MPGARCGTTALGCEVPSAESGGATPSGSATAAGDLAQRGPAHALRPKRLHGLRDLVTRPLRAGVSEKEHVASACDGLGREVIQHARHLCALEVERRIIAVLDFEPQESQSRAALAGKTAKKVIIVPGRMVNLITR